MTDTTPMNRKYFMIHNPKNAKPTVRHESLDDASEEAWRLAAENPGEVFNLLESTLSFTTEKPKIVVTQLQ